MWATHYKGLSGWESSTKYNLAEAVIPNQLSAYCPPTKCVGELYVSNINSRISIGLDNYQLQPRDLDPIGLIQPQSSTQPSVNNNANHQALTETVDESDKFTIKKTTAVHVGEGLPPIPGRIADKIVCWEYVDMWELLPEFWSNPTGSEGASRLERLKARSQQTTVWAQCFALYVSVMAITYPEFVSKLMAYMCTIIRASQEYEN